MAHDHSAHEHCEHDVPKFDDDIEVKQLTYGFAVVPIYDVDPLWAFTVGLERSAGHPELAVSGLPSDFAGELLNGLGFEILGGREISPDDEIESVIRGHRIRTREVPRSSYAARFGTATRFYGGESYRVIQLVWNDSSGAYPGDPSSAGVVNQELL